MAIIRRHFSQEADNGHREYARRGSEPTDEDPVGADSRGNRPRKPGPTSRRKRRWAVRLAILALVIWFLPGILTHTPLLDYAIHLGTADLDGTLSIQAVSLGWLSPVSVTGIEVKDRKGRPVASVASVQGDRALAAILCNYTNLGRFDLQGVRLAAVVRDDGSNVEDVFAKYMVPKPQENKSSANIAVGVRIADASLSVTDLPTGQTWQTTKLALAFDMLGGTAGPMDASVEMGLTDQGRRGDGQRHDENSRRWEPDRTARLRFSADGPRIAAPPGVARNIARRASLDPSPADLVRTVGERLPGGSRLGACRFRARHRRLAPGRASPGSFPRRLPGVVPRQSGGRRKGVDRLRRGRIGPFGQPAAGRAGRALGSSRSCANGRT